MPASGPRRCIMHHRSEESNLALTPKEAPSINQTWKWTKPSVQRPKLNLLFDPDVFVSTHRGTFAPEAELLGELDALSKTWTARKRAVQVSARTRTSCANRELAYHERSRFSNDPVL